RRLRPVRLVRRPGRQHGPAHRVHRRRLGVRTRAGGLALGPRIASIVAGHPPSLVLSMLGCVPTLTCARCGAPLPEEARFCPRCGAPVAAAVTEERRVVTVLFADVTASTELAASLDAERFREVMAEFYRM